MIADFEMPDINPNTIYYLIVYALIFAMRYFKIHTEVKNKTNGTTWRNYFSVGLEFVYSSLGLMILLAAASHRWGYIIFAGFLLVFYITSQFEAKLSEWSPKTAVVVNIIVVLVIIAGTTVANQTVLYTDRDAPKAATPTIPAAHRYSVAIPYFDYTLRKYVGDNFGARRLSYVTDVTAHSREEAMSAAISKFWDKANVDVEPYDQKRQKGPDDLIVQTDGIVIEARD